jgi:formylglycine-generating enzyme required for sulfatase activity
MKKVYNRLRPIYALFFILFYLPLGAQKLNNISFSKDSLSISGFLLNYKVFSQVNRVVSFSIINKNIIVPDSLNINYVNFKIQQIVKNKEGIKIKLRFINISSDTIRLHNVLPFSIQNNQVYITGKGDHSLSRTHLFIPDRNPVNIIVPDNAWELGYNTTFLKDSISLYGFSRRNKSSLQNGKVKRFETILYPAGTIEYTIWLEPYVGNWQSGLLKVFRDRKLYDVDNFNDSLYKRPDLMWMRNAYTMHLMMAWDKFFYDPIEKRYLIKDFLQRGNKLYGGDDIISIWPTWPTLGLDQRNQFDLFKDLPGGLDSIRSLSNFLIQQNKHLFVSYNPWDIDTRSLNHYTGLAKLINQTNADGVVLDTYGSSTDSLQLAADSVRKGVIMYSEGMAVPKDMQGIISGRVHNALYYPPFLNLNKFIQPGFSIFRVAELYKEPIHREFATSFFNGYGTELNIMAPGQPEWVEEQYKTLGKTTQILRQLSDNFNSNQSSFLLPTFKDSIWVNKWPTLKSEVFTIYSILPSGFKGPLFKTTFKKGYHFVDMYNHELINPIIENDDATIEVETAAFHSKYLGTNNEGAIGCVAQLPILFSAQQIDGKITIQVNRPLPNTQFWVYTSNTQKTPLKFNYQSQSIDIGDIESRFEGKIIIQVIQKIADRYKLLDENILVIIPGTPIIIKSNALRNAPIVVNKKGMMLIPSGKFVFKQTHGDNFIPYPTFTDSTVILMNSYWMDQTPVTNEQFLDFIIASKYKPSDTTNFLKHWVGGKPELSDLHKPVVNISYEDASAYARFYNKLLPTEMEWQYAAQTSDLNEWPWKQEYPVTREYEEITNTLSVIKLKGIDSTYANLGNGVLDAVGAHPKGINPNGLLDLVGSVWQLTKDKYISGSYEYIILKGGSYFKPSGSWWYVQAGPRELTYAQYLLRVSQGFERNSTVGFRCIAKNN